MPTWENGGKSGVIQSHGKSAIFCSSTLDCRRLQKTQGLMIFLADKLTEAGISGQVWKSYSSVLSAKPAYPSSNPHDASINNRVQFAYGLVYRLSPERK